MFNYIYSYFKTKKNISKKELENNPNIFELSPVYEKSILDTSEFKSDIEEYIKKNNLKKEDSEYIERIGILKELSDIYDHYIKNNDIDDFIIKFIEEKEEINKIHNSIDNSIYIQKELTYKIINNSKKPMIYENPIVHKYNKHLFEDFLLENLNKNLYIDNYNNIKISLDILLTGNIINLSLPSIGLVNSIYSKDTKTIKSMIDNILNTTNLENSILKEVPLLSLNIGDTISSILLNTNNNYFTKKNEKITNMLNNIQIDLNNIFFKKDTNKKKDKIKTEYIIPYKYDLSKDLILLMSKIEIEKISTIDHLMDHNKKVFLIILTKLEMDKFTSEDGIKKLSEKNNYKNVLACFLFFIIRIVCDIIKEYINNIDILLTQLLNVKNKKYELLNIEDAFKYTTLLNISLYKFKLILFNNFYHLFFPSKIIKNNYGMEKDANNCYVPESNSIFMNSDINIYENFPIRCENTNSNKSKNKFVLSRLEDFILNIKENYDIYNNEDILEFGGYSFNKEIMKISVNKINNNYTLLQKNNNLILFIIDKIIDNFQNEYIPYELISDLLSKKDIIGMIPLTPVEKEKLKKEFIYKFNEMMTKSTTYYIKLLEVRNKINKEKKINDNTLYNTKLIYTLGFKLYRMKSICIKMITINLINNTDLKTTLLNEYDKIKESCEKNIKNVINKKK